MKQSHIGEVITGKHCGETGKKHGKHRENMSGNVLKGTNKILFQRIIVNIKLLLWYRGKKGCTFGSDKTRGSTSPKRGVV